MFAFAGLLLIPWLWFAWGISIALVFLICISLVTMPFLYWRSFTVFFLGLFVIGALELQTQHTLPYSQQHQSFPLTICADPLFKQFDDVRLGTAIVVSQPKQLSLRKVSAALPEKFTFNNSPGVCIQGFFRVKQPFGTLLPNQFNVDQYYYSQQIDAKVTLVSLTDTYAQSALMYRLFDSVGRYFQEETHLQLWTALVMGWSSVMSSELKALLASNQLAHMFVVSGFHIGVIALFVNLLFLGIAKLLAPIYRVNIALRYIAVLLITSSYVAFIGWPIPALRALIMAAVPLLSLLLRMKLHTYQSIVIAALIVLVCFPETWLSVGNWLSFGSVLLIVMAYRWQLFAKFSTLSSVLLFQCLMSILSLFWCYFYGLSFNFLGFVINLIASPVITFFIFPLALLITVFPSSLVFVFEWITRYSLVLIEQTALLGIEGNTRLSMVVLGVSLFLALVAWSPNKKLFISWTIVITLLGMSAWYQNKYVTNLLPKNEIHIRMFDVGHGLAALIKVHNKTYLYDTGGRIGRTESVYGRKLSNLVSSLNALIVSHSDADHSAGATEVFEQFPNIDIYAGQPGSLTMPAFNCHKESINSSTLFFIPIPAALQLNDNDQSCILVLRNERFSMVFTGDAGRNIEYYLMQAYPHLLPFDIVVLGHHGSDSSSSSQWLSRHEDAVFINSGADMARGAWPSKRITQWFKHESLSIENTAKRGTLDIFVTQVDIRLKSYESAFRKRLIY